MSPAGGTIGIVLVGGRASRLADIPLPAGGKAALEFAGRSFLVRIVDAVGAEVDRVLVVAAPGQPLPDLPATAEIIRDSDPGAGPLAGIRDGLAAAARLRPPPTLAVVCAGDLPLVRSELVRFLVARGRAGAAGWLVPAWDGHPQVLLSVIRVDMLPRIEAYLATGRRDPRGLLAALEAESPGLVGPIAAAELAAIDPTGESVRDVDTPADLEWLRDRGIPPSSP